MALVLPHISRLLSLALQSAGRGAAPYVYDPVEYAWRPHYRYLATFGTGPVRTLFLGMNPGPFGMAQTGVPFGDPVMVRDFLGILEPVDRPVREHPRRPVLGFESPRKEISGTRLWGWVRARYGTPEAFFRSRFVWNYCPLLFLEESGRNRTPDKLPRRLREPIFEACDTALRAVCSVLGVEWVVGVGRFAERRAAEALGDTVRIVGIPHPSPANPGANRGWSGQVESLLEPLGLLE